MTTRTFATTAMTWAITFFTYIFVHTNIYPPANVSDDPAATDVQPVTPSPIRPHPFPLINTVVDPVVIGAACDGQGVPGNKCDVLLSSCLDIPMLFTNTSADPAALVIPEQCATSASPILVIAAITSLL